MRQFRFWPPVTYLKKFGSVCDTKRNEKRTCDVLTSMSAKVLIGMIVLGALAIGLGVMFPRI
jgi:hypothetical protein